MKYKSAFDHVNYYEILNVSCASDGLKISTVQIKTGLTDSRATSTLNVQLGVDRIVPLTLVMWDSNPIIVIFI